MLYPRNTESRIRISLNGVWEFALIRENEAYDASVPLKDGRPMPVPCSFNDIYEGREIRDHVGKVVYERTVENVPCPDRWSRILHFGSVTHSCEIYWNGTRVGSHKGGFLPFEICLDQAAHTAKNRLTVIADNIVDHTTLPCGTVQSKAFPGMAPETFDYPNFDFFNYSGIQRPVDLCLVPRNRIESVSLDARADGTFRYQIGTNGKGTVSVQVLDGEKPLFEQDGTSGCGVIAGVTPWSPVHPKLYDCRITYYGEEGYIDTYTEQFGFRTVEVKDCGLYLNGEKIYLKGFGKHEDSPVSGRGFQEAFNVKDLALMKWMGANSFRTSHYPYSEEMMQLCDRMGILVIDETPAVGMHTTFTATGMKVDVTSPTWDTLKTQKHHAYVIRDLISRDGNHPSVIMWSIANEPASEENGAYEYFKPLFDLVRKADWQNRPVTFAAHGEATVLTCRVSPLCDVLLLNRYYGWYTEEGNLKAAEALLADELDRYHAAYPDKPVMLSEFGADAVAGFHDSTAQMFSEEFQRDLVRTYCEVLDRKDYVCGEHVWNFADFATAESVKRAQGNKKGVFTRERKPKAAVWYLKERWEHFEEK